MCSVARRLPSFPFSRNHFGICCFFFFFFVRTQRAVVAWVRGDGTAGVNEYSLTAKTSEGVRLVSEDERMVLQSSTQLVGTTLAMSFKRPLYPSKNIFAKRPLPKDVRPITLSAANFVFARGPLAQRHGADRSKSNEINRRDYDNRKGDRVVPANVRTTQLSTTAAPDHVPPQLARHVFRRSGAVDLKLGEVLSAATSGTQCSFGHEFV